MRFNHRFASQRTLFPLASGAFVCLLLFTFFASSLTTPTAFATSGTKAATPDIAAINAFVQKTMQQKGIPGVELAIVHGNQVVDLRGFGRANDNGAVVTPQTPFEIGSMTKSFTALATMQLVEQGKIDLRTPVQHYIPWFRVADVTASARITIADLLHHTSGIPDGTSVELASLTRPDMTIEQYVRALNTVVLDRSVGSSFEYSNTNYVILGLLIQTVSGQSYMAYVQQHILDPLDMHNTYLSYAQAMQHRASLGYNWLFGAVAPVNPGGQTGLAFQTTASVPPSQIAAGGVISSAEDMSHFLTAIMNGGRYGIIRVLSAQDVATLQAPSTPIPANVFPGEKGAYGMGWFNGTYYGVPAIFHTGTTLTFKAFQVMDPQHRWGAIILMNAATPLLQEPFDAIKSGVVDMLTGHMPVPVGGMTLTTFYLITDIVLVILSLLIIWRLTHLLGWSRNLSTRLEVGQYKRRFKIWRVSGVLFDIVSGCIALVSVIVVVGSGSLRLALILIPDLSMWLLLAGVLMLLSGVTRAIMLQVQLTGKNMSNDGTDDDNDVSIKSMSMKA